PRDQYRDADPDHAGDGRHAPGLRASFAADGAAGRGAVEAPRNVVPARPARAGCGEGSAPEPDGSARLLAAGGAEDVARRDRGGLRPVAVRRRTNEIRRRGPLAADAPAQSGAAF